MSLVLFDIDGTLLHARGLGVRAMETAGRTMWPSFSLESIEIAGCIDTLIWRAAAERAGVPDPDAQQERFRSAYATALAALIDEPGEGSGVVHAIPGAPELVAAVREREGLGLGVLTGNYPETGRMKLTAAGFDLDHFMVEAWGCDAQSRRGLPPVAMDRFRARWGRDVAPADVVIIGDTPHDIDCAHANGCRAIAVASGMFDRAALADHEPDLLLDDLGDTARLVAWIESGSTHAAAEEH